jgi:hypothetical protein
MAASEEALKTGQNILSQVKEGQPLKSTLINEGKRGVDVLLDKAGLPKQFGGGRKSIKRGRKSVPIPNHQTIIGSTVNKPIVSSKKRLRSDAFGLY